MTILLIPPSFNIMTLKFSNNPLLQFDIFRYESNCASSIGPKSFTDLTSTII